VEKSLERRASFVDVTGYGFVEVSCSGIKEHCALYSSFVSFTNFHQGKRTGVKAVIKGRERGSAQCERLIILCYASLRNPPGGSSALLNPNETIFDPNKLTSLFVIFNLITKKFQYSPL